ncbi:MAG: glycosyltransferase [Desulfopila sp.]
MTGRGDRNKTILWWGRFDPDYSRNRILRQLLRDDGYTLRDFRPYSSGLGTVEEVFARTGAADAVWVGAFRQRDFAAARSFADRQGIPLIFDPLISAWEKSVFERKRFRAQGRRAMRLKQWEQRMFASADLVLADTDLHARFFIDNLRALTTRTLVVPVGAEEKLFFEQPHTPPLQRPEILFYGSFISLQGPEVIVEAARQVPEARWTMLGDGPLRRVCENKADGSDHIVFENWCPYEQLAARIGQADVLLGVFGTSDKAGRVIPNKAYQALACGRPLITRRSAAYPAVLGSGDSGVHFVSPGDSASLARVAQEMVTEPARLPALGRQARASYERHFSASLIHASLLQSLRTLL